MALELIHPTDTERFIAMHYVLKPCPFCGHQGPLLSSYVNATPTYGSEPLYQGRIFCVECCASVFCNHKDLDSARTAVIERWQTRAPKPDPVVSYQEAARALLKGAE